MTCIVGLIHKGDVWLGGDSAGVAAYDLTVRADAKVFRRDEFLFGFTSSFRMGQLLRYKLTIARAPKEDANLHEWMSTDFIDAVRQTLKDGGYAQIKEGTETGGSFIVGYRRKLFVIDDDYQVGEPLDPFTAVGCGAQIALGSLYSTSGDPKLRITKALEASERFSSGVRAPFLILSSKVPK